MKRIGGMSAMATDVELIDHDEEERERRAGGIVRRQTA